MLNGITVVSATNQRDVSLCRVAGAMPNYCFTVNSLLRKAGRRKPRVEEYDQLYTDHIVEMQLIVAALNTLPNDTYSRNGWAKDLVNFFNNRSNNLQYLQPSKNRKKGTAVRRWIDGKELSTADMEWIIKIRRHWDKIKDHLPGFKCFKWAVDDLLSEDELDEESETESEEESEEESEMESEAELEEDLEAEPQAMDYEVEYGRDVWGRATATPYMYQHRVTRGGSRGVRWVQTKPPKRQRYFLKDIL